MGLRSNEDDDVVVDSGDGDVGDRNSGGKSFGSVSCSICLELVADNGDRSWAKLQCGHEFHLDCIGSAFNIKGAMQCPNCRKIEKGQWLYANGCRSFPEFSMDDWAHDEDLYDLSYSEMSFGVHWCPFGGFTRLPSIEEGEFSSNAYHDLLGQHASFAEPTAVSSATHPCPYITYFGPIHPSSSNTGGSVSDVSNFNNPWNCPSVHSEIPTSYALPAMDLRYQSGDQHSYPFPTSGNRIGSSDQTSIPSVTQRLARTHSDIPRAGSFVNPFFVGHSARAGSSVASSIIPPYPGSNVRTRDRVQALQAYSQLQQPDNSPAMRTPVPNTRRSDSHRGTSQVRPAASSSDQNGGFYFFQPGTSGHNFQEAENPLPNRYQAWERDRLPPLSLNHGNRDSRRGAFHQAASEAFHQAAGGSDPGLRPSSLRLRHGSEQTLSQNQS